MLLLAVGKVWDRTGWIMVVFAKNSLDAKYRVTWGHMELAMMLAEMGRENSYNGD